MQQGEPVAVMEWSRSPGWLTRVERYEDGSREVIELFKGQEVERRHVPAKEKR